MAQKYNPFLTPKFKREIIKRIKDKYQDTKPTKIDYGYGSNPIKEEYLIRGYTEAQIINNVNDEFFEIDSGDIIFNNLKHNGEKLRLYEIVEIHELEFQNMVGVKQKVLNLSSHNVEVISGNNRIYGARIHKNTKFDIPHKKLIEIVENVELQKHYEIEAYIIFFSGWSICTTIKVHKMDRTIVDEEEDFLGDY